MEMRKIKLNSFKLENKVIEYENQKIEIVPYISTELAIAIFNLCENTLSENHLFYDVKKMPLFKTLFDMVVVSQCSNIEIEGISKILVGDGSFIINVDIDKNIILDFERSGITSEILKHIGNYGDVWSMIESFVRDIVVMSTFSAMGNSMPTPEDLSQSIESIKSLVEKVKEGSEGAPKKIANGELGCGEHKSTTAKHKASKSE